MNVAIPKFGKNVAPCFEAAKQFEIIQIKDNKITSTKTVECPAGEGFKRVRLLHLHDTEILICNGIKDFYRYQLATIRIDVISNINESIEKAIQRYIADDLPSCEMNIDESPDNYDVSHDDLINWGRELFESNGYKVTLNESKETFLMDLIAEIKCPSCEKMIKIAICCGGHTYRPDQEIQEFHHLVKSLYNARVFIYTDSPQIAKNCDEYGIEFISPEMVILPRDNISKKGIPILSGPVEGHDKINLNRES